ncbi:ABC transporter transmembrane domain-containing protein, partial [Acinetobacter baumannii]
MIAQLGLLKNLTIESIWLQRFKSLMSKFNLAQRDSERLDNFVNNIGEFIIGVAITILIFWGTIRVMEGRISAGVLIAMIMLV